MKRKPAEALSRFWATDRGLSILLGFLVVAVFLLPLLRDIGPLRRVVRDVTFSLLLISGAGAVSERRPTFLLISVVATAALLVRWLSWLAPSDVLEQWRAVSLLASLGLLSLVVLAQVFRKGPVTLHRVRGAIAAYLLLGLTWGFAYELVALTQPGAFAGPGVEVAASEIVAILQFCDAHHCRLRRRHAHSCSRSLACHARSVDWTALPCNPARPACLP